MLRYLALSAAIVLGIGIVVAAWVNRDLIQIKIASVYARVPPKAAPPNPQSSAASAAMRGDAPWALSALPDCFMQVSKSTGPRAYLLRHLPSRAAAVASPAKLAYGNCTIFVIGDEAYVRRGADRFRIPPKSRFYRAPGELALLRESPEGDELRVYRPNARIEMTK